MQFSSSLLRQLSDEENDAHGQSSGSDVSNIDHDAKIAFSVIGSLVGALAIILAANYIRNHYFRSGDDGDSNAGQKVEEPNPEDVRDLVSPVGDARLRQITCNFEDNEPANSISPIGGVPVVDGEKKVRE